MNDILLGQIVVNTFVTIQRKNYFFSNLTYQDVLDTQKYPDIFLDGLGYQFRVVLSGDEGQLEDAMDALSRASNGKIPTQNSFHIAMRDRAISPSLFESASAVFKGTAVEVIKGTEAIGNQLIDTGKFLTWIFPVAVVGALFVIGKSWVKRVS